jgi:hypothetical protein
MSESFLNTSIPHGGRVTGPGVRMDFDRQSQPRRSLGMDELELIEALIGAARTGVSRYLGQLEKVKVVGHCLCGCPSIDLEVTEKEKNGRPTPLVMADAESPEGAPVGVILWVRDGELSGLEVHPWDGTQYVRLPLPETLENIRVRPT